MKRVYTSEAWALAPTKKKPQIFARMPREEAEDLFLEQGPIGQKEILEGMLPAQRKSWLRLLAPDDAADLLQEVDDETRAAYLALIDDNTRREVLALMAYAEDKAGGLMNPRYVRLRPDMSVEEAIRYLRVQASTEVETVYYVYVLDHDQTLMGVLSFREILLAPRDAMIKDIMRKDFVALSEHADQEEASKLFAQYDLLAIPVVDDLGHVKGIVTVDDIVHVVQEEATEDIQKMGGTQVLEAPYLNVGLFEMLKKRAGWLTVLFLGEMFTATAMAYFEHEIAKAVVLALFIPLIISSGGNSGSQASTLVIRAIALGEVRLRDWFRVLWREIRCGALLGLMLGAIGFLRVVLWPARARVYGEHYVLIALTVGGALVGVVLWGATAGAMLPFILRRAGLDPAAASAPFVATIVDVTGLIIYFSVASVFLSGTLL